MKTNQIMNMMSIYYRSGAYKMTQGNSFHRGTTYSFHRGIVKGDTLGKCPGFQGFKRVHNTLLQPHDFSIYSKFFVNKDKDNKRHSEIPCEFPMWAPIRILT